MLNTIAVTLVPFLPLVCPAGVGCEKAMLQATADVNTHKGAIFPLGLLCAAAGRLLAAARVNTASGRARSHPRC
jgi:triphosphoribosyl-dephospho-CoA synthase